MFSIILISDVHSNYIALQKVLETINDEQIIHAGDVIGYNPYPNETVELFLKHQIISIAGNHDRSLVSGNLEYLNYYAQEAINYTHNKITENHLKYISSLPDRLILNLEGKKIAMHHGAPFDEDFYIYEEDVSEELLKFDDPDVLVLGHTHQPYVRRFGERLIINPGSVGQPRDGDWRLSFAKLDLKNLKCEIVRLEYDVKQVYEKILESKIPQFLGERLFLGF